MADAMSGVNVLKHVSDAEGKERFSFLTKKVDVSGKNLSLS